MNLTDRYGFYFNDTIKETYYLTTDYKYDDYKHDNNTYKISIKVKEFSKILIKIENNTKYTCYYQYKYDSIMTKTYILPYKEDCCDYYILILNILNDTIDILNIIIHSDYDLFCEKVIIFKEYIFTSNKFMTYDIKKNCKYFKKYEYNKINEYFKNLNKEIIEKVCHPTNLDNITYDIFDD